MSTPEKSIITNDKGDLIAWVYGHSDSPGGCLAVSCRKALLAGLPVHIVPAHTDPRAKNWTLSMPSYHFATIEEAEKGLNDAWDSCVMVETKEERDGAYAMGYPVAISHRPDPATFR